MDEGYAVNIKIVASNAYGSAPISEPGAGAVIQFPPDYPINLVNNPLITNQERIGLSWSDGPSDGGSAVIDYRVSYD